MKSYCFGICIEMAFVYLYNDEQQGISGSLLARYLGAINQESLTCSGAVSSSPANDSFLSGLKFEGLQGTSR